MIEMVVILAQTIIPTEAWKVAAQSGFLGILVLLQFLVLYLWRKDDNDFRERELKRMDLVIRSTTDMMLALQWVPDALKSSARQRVKELDDERQN